MMDQAALVVQQGQEVQTAFIALAGFQVQGSAKRGLQLIVKAGQLVIDRFQGHAVAVDK